MLFDIQRVVTTRGQVRTVGTERYGVYPSEGKGVLEDFLSRVEPVYLDQTVTGSRSRQFAVGTDCDNVYFFGAGT